MVVHFILGLVLCVPLGRYSRVDVDDKACQEAVRSSAILSAFLHQSEEGEYESALVRALVYYLQRASVEVRRWKGPGRERTFAFISDSLGRAPVCLLCDDTEESRPSRPLPRLSTCTTHAMPR